MIPLRFIAAWFRRPATAVAPGLLGVLWGAGAMGCGPEPLPPPSYPLSQTTAGAIGEAPPTPESLPEAQGAAVEVDTLGNGIRVVTLPQPRATVVFAVTVVGAGGRAPHRAELSVLRHALEASTVVDGEVVDRYLAETDVHPDFVRDGAALTVTVRAEPGVAARALASFAQALRSPALREADVERSKSDAIREIRESANFSASSLRDLALLRLYGETYTTDPLAADRIESVRAVGEAELRAAHALYFQPSQIHVVVAGPISRSEAVAMSQAAFGDWPRGGHAAPESRALTAQPVSDVGAVATADEQVELAVTLDSPSVASGDSARVRVFAEAVAGMRSSLLETLLRERLGHTYGVRMSVRTVGPNRSVLEIGARFAADDARDDIDDFLDLLRDALAGELTEEIVERAKRSLKADITYRAFENRIAARVARRVGSGGEPRSTDAMLEEIDQVSLGDVRGVGEVLSMDRASIMIRGHWRTLQYMEWSGWDFTWYRFLDNDGRG